MNEINKKCKFCGQEKDLIGAHIIPRKFYLIYKKSTINQLIRLKGNQKLSKLEL